MVAIQATISTSHYVMMYDVASCNSSHSVELGCFLLWDLFEKEDERAWVKHVYDVFLAVTGLKGGQKLREEEEIHAASVLLVVARKSEEGLCVWFTKFSCFVYLKRVESVVWRTDSKCVVKNPFRVVKNRFYMSSTMHI